MLILWETKSEGRLLTNVRKNFLTLGEEDADDANIHQNGGYWFLTAAVTRPPTYWLLARWTYYLQFFRSVVGRRFPWATATVSRPYSFWGCREELTRLFPASTSPALLFSQPLHPPTSASIFNSPSRLWPSFLPLTKAQWLGPAG